MWTKKDDGLALIDGDILAYKAGFIYDKNPSDVDIELLLRQMLHEWKSSAYCNHAIIFLSGKSFRYDIYPEYKSNRKDKPRPTLIKEIFSWLKDGNVCPYPCMTSENLEADDMIGIKMTCPQDTTPVCVSIDKDMLMIPGWHYNPDKSLFPYYIDTATANRNLAIQILTGDSVDGYDGIPKIGPVRARKLLETDLIDSNGDVLKGENPYEDYWKAKEYYTKFELGEEHFQRNVNLAYILTYANICPETNINTSNWGKVSITNRL